MTLALAVRGLTRHPIRTGLVILGVAVAAALLLDMVMLSGGMERSFERMLLSRGFQIRLSPKGTLPFDTEAHLKAWAEHPDHRAAQERGRHEFFDEYRIDVCEPTRAYAFDAARGRHDLGLA